MRVSYIFRGRRVGELVVDTVCIRARLRAVNELLRNNETFGLETGNNPGDRTIFEARFAFGRVVLNIWQSDRWIPALRL